MQKVDKLTKQAEVSRADMGDEDLSPMDPPDAYTPPSTCELDLENLHPFLMELLEEHREINSYITEFESCLQDVMRRNDLGPNGFAGFSKFMNYFDDEFVPHNKREEGHFFSLVNERLIEAGEFGEKNGKKFTGIKILEEDHIDAIKLGAKITTLLELLAQLNHISSRNILQQKLFQTAKQLVELLKLHIFREDNIIFGQAQKLLKKEELDQLLNS